MIRALSVLAFCALIIAGCSTSDATPSPSSSPPSSEPVPADIIQMRETYNDDVLVYACDSAAPGLPTAQCIGTSLNRLNAIEASTQGLSDSQAKSDILKSINTWKTTRDQYATGKCWNLGVVANPPQDPTNCKGLEVALYEQWKQILTAMGW